MPDLHFKNTFTTTMIIRESPIQEKSRIILETQEFWDYCSTLVDAMVDAELAKRLGVLDN